MILINTIQGCSCCSEAEMILNIYNIPFTKINVKNNEKINYKKKYNMQSFPQIFYKNKNNKKLKIGGLTELKHLISICNFLKKNNYSNELISYFKRFTSDC